MLVLFMCHWTRICQARGISTLWPSFESPVIGGWVLVSLLGDMNSGLNSLDEETEYSHNYKATFMNPMQASGWRDMFRVLHPNEDAPTWFSRNNRGFRLDQAFVNPELQPHVTSCFYDWGRAWNEKKLSDHAAILLDLELPS